MRIKERTFREIGHLRLDYTYRTRYYYEVKPIIESDGWTISLRRKTLSQETEVRFEDSLFAPHVNGPRVFAASVGGEDVGWLEVGHDAWNNRLRVWELMVKEGHRRRGIGTALMNKAKTVAKAKGARMIVLETQSCNFPAISFYRSLGFKLIGLDTHAYSNRDVERDVVRLEFGLETGKNGPFRTIHLH